MAKVRLLIIEDERAEALELQESLTHLGYEITGIAPNLKEALGLFYSQSPDLVLIDIYLDGKPDGLKFAQTLNDNPQTKKPFIFLTKASDKITFDKARETQPDSYLLKPFNPLEVQYAIELAIEKHYGGGGAFTTKNELAIEGDHDFFIKKGNVLHRVSTSDIYFVEVDGKYSQLTTASDSYLVQWSLKHVIDKINRSDFIRVHRNYAINTQMISKVHLKDQQLVLKNEKTIPISQNFKENLTKRMDILR